jgi:hypothetical protein
MCGWYPPAGVQTGNFVSAFVHSYNDTHILGSLNYFFGDWFTPQSSGDDFNREGSPPAVSISDNLDDIFWLDADGCIKHQQWWFSAWVGGRRCRQRRLRQRARGGPGRGQHRCARVCDQIRRQPLVDDHQLSPRGWQRIVCRPSFDTWLRYRRGLGCTRSGLKRLGGGQADSVTPQYGRQVLELLAWDHGRTPLPTYG